MGKTKPSSPKNSVLRQRACLNPRPENVQDSLFHLSDFFDPNDLVQVKYEMLRRVRVEGDSISQAAKTFGFSRPAFYKAQASFEQGGIPALVPKRPGPRRAHKLGAEVVNFLLKELAGDSSIRSDELAERIRKHFDIQVHPRSVERALERHKKKRPSPPPT